MSLKLIIADDNKNSRELIRYKILNSFESQIHLASVCNSIEEMIGAIFIHQPHIVVLDLKLFDQTHISVLERLVALNGQKLKIVVMAVEDQMDKIQSIVEVGIAALLRKPINTEDIKNAIGKIVRQFDDELDKSLPIEKFITLRSNRSKMFINQNDILFIESNRNVCILTLKDGQNRTVNESISSLEKRLDVKDLVRIDKSTIINISKIAYLENEAYNRHCKLKLLSGDEVSKALSKTGIERLYKITTNLEAKLA